jgi:glyceraldehyde-3-phosphate dehydrogenase/erythrose-4-phosphate dehydrogenase
VTANCAAPIIKLVDDAFGLSACSHLSMSKMNDQRPADASKEFRCARAAKRTSFRRTPMPGVA